MGRPPHETLWHLATAGVAARCLHVVAELGVADLLDDEPRTAADLAARCGADADALNRVLRLLTGHGVFAAAGSGYVHTEASRILRADHPASLRPTALMSGLPVFTGSLVELGHSVRTGGPAAEVVSPGGLWGYLREHPEAGRVFDAAMSAKAGPDIAAVLAAVDFGRFDTVADVGGGRGHLLRAVLDATPGARGVLVDLPDVLASLGNRGERLRLHAADFFTDPLPDADAYVLMEVVHDWADAESAAILAAVRRACRPGAAVLIVENLLAEDAPDLRGWTLDILMLAVTGGRERTPTELGALLDAAGFRVEGVTPTAGRVKVLEATAR